MASFVASRPVVSMSKQRMIICRLGRATLQHPLPPEVLLECSSLLVGIRVARTGGTVGTTPQPTHSLGSVPPKPVLRWSSKPPVVVNQFLWFFNNNSLRVLINSFFQVLYILSLFLLLLIVLLYRAWLRLPLPSPPPSGCEERGPDGGDHLEDDPVTAPYP